jgi:hypothetical protein
MPNKFQAKRTSVTGRTPNTTNIANSSFIDAGEFAVNLTDRKLFSSNGTASFEVGSNLTSLSITSSVTLDNDAQLRFKTLNGNTVGFRQQNDDNFVFYTTNTAGGDRAVFAIYANTVSSNLSILVPTVFNANVYIGALSANGSLGTAGQVLSSNGTGVYWATPGSTGGLLAGNGLTSNATHYAVLANTGIVANSTGTFVNATYIATLTANNANNLNGQPASFYTNATNLATGTVPFARLPSLFLGTTTIQSTSAAQAVSGITTLAAGNTTITGFANVTSTIQGGSSLTIAGAASGITTLAAGNTTITGFANVSTSVNSALLTVGTSFIANTVGAFHTGTMNAASFTTTNFRANTTGVFPTSNTVGNALGNTTARWALSATTGSFNDAVSGITTLAAGNTTITGFANVSTTLQVGTNTATFGTAAYIVANGNVGIGNTAPPNRLFVTGDIGLDGISVRDTATLTTTANTQVTLIQYPTATYNTGEFIIQAVSNGVIHTTKMLVVCNTTVAIATEFGSLFTGGSLYTVDTDISAANTRILITPASAVSTVFKTSYELITA